MYYVLDSGRVSPDYPLKILWTRGFIRLVLVGGIIWMFLILVVLLFHVWSCQSSFAFFSGYLHYYAMPLSFMLFYQNFNSKSHILYLPYRCNIYLFWLFAALCNKDSKVFGMLNTMGLVQPPHRMFAGNCHICSVLKVTVVCKLIYFGLLAYMH